MRDAGPYPIGHSGIRRIEQLSLRASFVFSAAYNARRFQIKLGEIRVRLPILGVELDRTLKLGVHFLCQSCRLQESGTIRLLTVDTTKPEVVKPIIGREGDGFFAGGNSSVPIVELRNRRDKSEVIGFPRIAEASWMCCSRIVHRLVDVTASEKILSGVSAAAGSTSNVIAQAKRGMRCCGEKSAST